MTGHARRSRWLKPAAGLITVAALSALPALTGCAGVDTASASEATLERFTSCASLTEYAQRRALELVGPYGLDGTVAIAGGGPAVLGAEDRTAAPQASAKVAGADFSATNVQEAGVDEPDIVKTDGDRIFALARNRIYAVDASGPQPRIAGSLQLPQDGSVRDMLLAGDRLLVMSDGPADVRPLPASGDQPAGRLAPDAPGGAVADILPARTGAILTEIDVSDPSAMRVAQSLRTEARYVTARLSGTTARVVMTASPTALTGFTFPAEPGAAAEAKALAANRRALTRTTADDWLPRYTVQTAAGTSAPRPLAPCTAVSRPAVFSGLDSLTILTVDLTRGLDPIDADTVMASGENVYAASDALYVATSRWAAAGANGAAAGVDTTQIHKFATSSTSQTEYRGSGSVTGHLLNQFSMSELDGRLRVATTDGGETPVGADAVVPGAEGRPSESYVTVLEERDGNLRQIGRVGGLGKGERISAVRFIGTTGYVVTFRQTDPLYTIDLSDPTAPRVAGELKIAGYSAYLHPIGDGLLIGVGQDATEEGRTKGLQISLFDVSDPAAPKRLRQGVMPGASSEAEWDHHAFLWWPKASLAVVPYTRFDVVPAGAPATSDPAGGGVGTGVARPFVAQATGALGMRVTRDGISEAGRVIHPASAQFDAGIRRSLVIGDVLYTMSDGGIRASNLADLSERAWLAFT